MRERALVLAIVLLAVPAGAASADPITYKLRFTASGVADGRPFTDERVALVLRGDTDRLGSAGGVTTQTVSCGTGICAAYVGGIGLAIGSIIKFKQHKDNPQQLTVALPPTSQGPRRLTLAGPALASYRLGEATGPLALSTRLGSPLNVTVTMGARRSQVSIRSIKGGRVSLEVDRKGGG